MEKTPARIWSRVEEGEKVFIVLPDGFLLYIMVITGDKMFMLHNIRGNNTK